MIIHLFLKYEEQITFSLLTFTQWGQPLDVSLETGFGILTWISTTSVTSHGNIMSGRLVRVVICVPVHVAVTACIRVSSCGTNFVLKKTGYS